MDDLKWSKETLKLQDLSLWDENARFPDKYFNKTQEELIEYFLAKKDFKVVELAKEVVAELDIPQLERMVVLRKDDKNIVIEGNRRLTVYKLLTNPELTKNVGVKTELEALALKAAIDDTFKLDVLVTEDYPEGIRLIERKHLKSNNEISWGDQERAHYSARKGETDRQTLIKVAVAQQLRQTGLDESLIDQVLGRGFVTTFQRIMTGSAATNVFGYRFDQGGNLLINDPKFSDKLRVVAWNVLQKKGYDGSDINSRSLNTAAQIQDYLSGIGDKEIDNTTGELQSSKSKNLFGEDTIEVPASMPGKRSLPRSTTRKYLIPKTCILQIDQPKINNIYRELKETIIIDDSKESSPNAAGVLFRVFLETSLDWFLEKHGITVKQEDNISNKIPRVVGVLKKDGKATDAQLKNINKVASSKPEVSLLSIENFHQYVHSSRRQPQPTDLKHNWDELQEFFGILWGCLHERHITKPAAE